MKYFKIIFLFLLLVSVKGIAKDEYKMNALSAYYGIENTFMIDYTRYLKQDLFFRQLVGLDLAFGNNFNHDHLVYSIGINGTQFNRNDLGFIFKMGVTLYDLKYYDVYGGLGLRKNRFNGLIKINIINAIEWLNVGIGYSF